MTKPEKSTFQTILAINTSSKDDVELALLGSNRQQVTERITGRAQDLQKFVLDFLASHDCGIADIDAVAIYRIADSLTGTRMGIASANTLAWLNNLPVIELDEQTFELSLKKIKNDDYTPKTVKQSSPLG